MSINANADLRQSADSVSLTKQLIDVPSESFDELVLADAVELFLGELPYLHLTRIGNTLIARTELGHDERVVIGGHLDTVPANGNLPHRVDSDRIYGLGACDMKGGVAVMLRLAVELTSPAVDLTFLFYECEEVSSEHNGLAKVAASEPQLLEADFAVLMEPSNAMIEAGCQGTLRANVTAVGERAHSARAWMGDNAIHNATEILDRLTRYQAKTVDIDGLTFREGLNAVLINGGIAGNVIPDACTVTVNYRYAPSMNASEAEEHVREIFEGFDVTIDDNAPGALPALSAPLAKSLIELVGERSVHPKLGWTDVSRFSALGIPALNYGPGDPSIAHSKNEFVPVAEIERCESVLIEWLSAHR